MIFLLFLDLSELGGTVQLTVDRLVASSLSRSAPVCCTFT